MILFLIMKRFAAIFLFLVGCGSHVSQTQSTPTNTETTADVQQPDQESQGIEPHTVIPTVTVRNPDTQRRYIPEVFSDLHIGMSIDEFRQVRDPQSMGSYLSMEFRIQLEEVIEEGDIVEVTYYFDKDLEGNPLYEMIIQYRPEFDLAAYVASVYGSPNRNQEWQFDIGESFPIRIWTYQNRLIIAGIIPGTEWVD